ncbi:hypothetical protein [Myroides sp. DW712]|uniref:hypothetical protein n=1 Tax=Myroides sp. DW712 TaxID=3389800 RepID=UPI00397E4A05
MEKLIIILQQMVKQGKMDEARRLATDIMSRFPQLIDLAKTDEELVRLAKMQKIVADVQQQIA